MPQERYSQTHSSSFARPGRWQPRWLAGAGLALLALVAYRPVWDAHFIFDDDIILTKNRLMQSAAGLRDTWFSTKPLDYFPLTYSSLWLERRLWGDHARGYHVTNVLLHLTACVLLWRLLSRLRVPGAWLAAAIFAVHPVTVESVAWITERKNTLAMPLFLASVLIYLQFERKPSIERYVAALVLFTFALLSKPAAVALPGALLALAYWQRGRIGRRDVVRMLPFVGVAIAAALGTVWFQWYRAMDGKPVWTAGFVARFALAGRAVGFYLGKTFWPTGLCAVYPRWRERTDLLAWLPTMLLSAGFAVLCWGRRRPWGRHGLAAACIYLLLLVPVLGFVDMSYMRFSLVADHWQYFALPMPIILAVATLAGAWQRCKPAVAWAWVVPAVPVAAMLAVLSMLTWRQCLLYHDAETLCRDIIATDPNSDFAHHYLAADLAARGFIDDAIAHFNRTLELRPDHESAHNNLGSLLGRGGHPAEAIFHLREAVRLKPKFPAAHLNLGTALATQGEFDEGLAHLRLAAELDPDHAGDAYFNIGTLLLDHGRSREAVDALRECLRTEPQHVEAHNNLGNALFSLGQVRESIIEFEAALRLDDDLFSAHYNLANSLNQLGRIDEAAAHWRRAIQLAPNNPIVLNRAAWVLATTPVASARSPSDAVAWAERASALCGGSQATVLDTLAASYAAAGRMPDAMATAERALNLAIHTRADRSVLELIQKHLVRYREGLPWIDETAQN